MIIDDDRLDELEELIKFYRDRAFANEIVVDFDPDVWCAIDRRRGHLTRSLWVQAAVIKSLMGPEMMKKPMPKKGGMMDKKMPPKGMDKDMPKVMKGGMANPMKSSKD